MRDQLLYDMQHHFPLTRRPFAELAQRLNRSEKEIIDTVASLKKEGIIRQTSAIFDTKRLGYRSSLVAFKVPAEDIEKAAAVINAHPGVSHNYERNHDFNLWFTLAVAPDSTLGLEQTVEILRKQSGATSAAVLPTLKMFKIKVQMDTTGKKAKKEKVHKAAYKPLELTDNHIAVVKALQKDIDITPEPFKRACEETGMDYDTLFAYAEEMREAGVMRRFATILNHRKAGFQANAMSVWNVPDDIAEETGRKLAEFSAVSHCYLRPRSEHWPYNLFAMVHAKTREACDALIDDMAKETGLHDYGKLYSTREFKKQRLIYFDEAFKRWEQSIEHKKA